MRVRKITELTCRPVRVHISL